MMVEMGENQPTLTGTPPRTDLAISMVLPGYNEESNIEQAVRTSLGGLGAFTDHLEVVLVDDGSLDRTGPIADHIAAESKALKVIHNPINLGVGTSLLIGFRAATGDVVFHNAMDYPFDLEDLSKVLPLFPAWDVVVVARTNRSAHSPWRKLTSVVNYWLIRLLFGIRLSDLNFVQAYKREVLESLTVKARSPAFVTPELLIRARDRGFKVTEIRATFHPRKRGKASYGKPRDILWTLADMLSFWLERRRQPKGPS
jgi:glycosyltransferase involved in cell wall biosynthesis